VPGSSASLIRLDVIPVLFVQMVFQLVPKAAAAVADENARRVGRRCRRVRHASALGPLTEDREDAFDLPALPTADQHLGVDRMMVVRMDVESIWWPRYDLDSEGRGLEASIVCREELIFVVEPPGISSRFDF
jgi:hypothetical protein